MNPTLIVFLLDQSASMQDAFGGSEQKGDAAPSKSRVLTDTVNRLLQNIILRCAKEDGVRDYFSIAVFGYGERVAPLLERSEDASSLDRSIVPVSYLADRPLRLETRPRMVPDGSGGQVERLMKHPVWFDPQAKNGTPMCQALDAVALCSRSWIDEHPEGFPPIVINVTDGEATDGDPLRYSREVTQLGTSDGDCLLFNIHLSDSTDQPMELPDSPEGLPDEFSRQLFEMSSRLPFSMRSAATNEGFQVTMDSRGFVFNADPAALIRFLEIGTRPSNLR